MIEAQAKLKVCPFKMAGTIGNEKGFNCEGSGCMGWDQWTEPIRADPGSFKITGHKPLDPPQGDCGMKPPELYCER